MAEELQNFECYAGDVFSIRVPVSDATGTGPAAFATPVAYWSAGRYVMAIDNQEPLLSKDSVLGGARIVQETISTVSWWVLYVDFAEVDTQDIAPGVHYHEARIVDGSYQSTVMTGTFTIKPTIIRD